MLNAQLLILDCCLPEIIIICMDLKKYAGNDIDPTRDVNLRLGGRPPARST